MAEEKNEQCMLAKSARSCMMAALGNEFCEGCGWNAAEQARRKNLPLEQFNLPYLSDLIDRIDNMKILVSRGDKAGKALGTKLPGQLSRKGFKTVLTTKKDGSDITVLQSKKDPNSVVILMYKKPQAIAASLKGDFSDIEDWKLGEEE